MLKKKKMLEEEEEALYFIHTTSRIMLAKRIEKNPIIKLQAFIQESSIIIYSHSQEKDKCCQKYFSNKIFSNPTSTSSPPSTI